MVNSEKKITIEFVNSQDNSMKTNPIKANYLYSDKNKAMAEKILIEELPMLKKNSYSYYLILYSILDKMNTIQNVKNVLSCIKEQNYKRINDVSFKDGEVFIKCST